MNGSVAMLSVQDQKALRNLIFSLKISECVFPRWTRSYEFGMTWGWVIKDRIAHFGCTIPLYFCENCDILFFMILWWTKLLNTAFIWNCEVHTFELYCSSTPRTDQDLFFVQNPTCQTVGLRFLLVSVLCVNVWGLRSICILLRSETLGRRQHKWRKW